jgi:putative hemolysin
MESQSPGKLVFPNPEEPPPQRPSPVCYIYYCAKSPQEVIQAQALRFQVFNLEMGIGCEESCSLGRDEDGFDAVCDHLLVRNSMTGQLVATCRLQTGPVAASNRGYVADREFDLAAMEPYRSFVLEIDRLCVEKQHRNRPVLAALWRGITDYAHQRRATLLLGSCPLGSMEENEALSLYWELNRRGQAGTSLRVAPWTTCQCLPYEPVAASPAPPLFLDTLLAAGARVFGAPSVNHRYRTVEFLVSGVIRKLDKTINKLAAHGLRD